MSMNVIGECDRCHRTGILLNQVCANCDDSNEPQAAQSYALPYECPQCGMRSEKNSPCPECKVSLVASGEVFVSIPFICWVCDGEMESREGKLVCVPCDRAYRESQKQLAEESEHLDQMTCAANQLHSEMKASRDAIDWLICNADDQPEWVREWVRDGFSEFPKK